MLVNSLVHSLAALADYHSGTVQWRACCATLQVLWFMACVCVCVRVRVRVHERTCKCDNHKVQAHHRVENTEIPLRAGLTLLH